MFLVYFKSGPSLPGPNLPGPSLLVPNGRGGFRYQNPPFILPGGVATPQTPPVPAPILIYVYTLFSGGILIFQNEMSSMFIKPNSLANKHTPLIKSADAIVKYK